MRVSPCHGKISRTPSDNPCFEIVSRGRSLTHVYRASSDKYAVFCNVLVILWSRCLPSNGKNTETAERPAACDLIRGNKSTALFPRIKSQAAGRAAPPRSAPLYVCFYLTQPPFLRCAPVVWFVSSLLSVVLEVQYLQLCL